MLHRFSFPTDIRVGPHVSHKLTEALTDLSVENPLVVTDSGFASLEVFGDFLKRLRSDSIKFEVFSGTQGNPCLSHVNAGRDAYRTGKHDSIVAIGGGAALDVGKAIGVAATQTHSLFEYVDEPGARAIEGELPPVVALPTTAGTGSEVGRSSVVSTDDTHEKKIIFSPKMMPRIVLVDPHLTVGLPAAVTAATGFDALTHNLEAYLTPAYNPMCSGIALEGLSMVFNNIATATEKPTDIAARTEMLMASLMGAVAFQKGLGLTHSYAHALSTVKDLHHGLANAIMVDHVMEYYLEACPEKWSTVEARLGLRPPSSAQAERPGTEFLRHLAQLKKRLGIPAGLAHLSLTENEKSSICRYTLLDVCHPSGPRAAEPESVKTLLDKVCQL